MKCNNNIPVLGDIRIVKKFLFFPKSLPMCGLTGTITCKWLETVYVTQVYKSKTTYCGDFCSHDCSYPDKYVWEDFAWMENSYIETLRQGSDDV